MTDLPNPIEIFTQSWNQPPLDSGFAKMTLVLLEDVPPEELSAALLHLAKTHGPFRPNAAEIRRTVVELRGLFPSEAEAGIQAGKLNDIRELYAMGGNCFRFPVVHPVVRDALDAAGFDSRAAFVKAYRIAVDRTFQAMQSGPLHEMPLLAPVRACRDHTPSELVWRLHGWWEGSERVHVDRGDQFPGRLGSADVRALGVGA